MTSAQHAALLAAIDAWTGDEDTTIELMQARARWRQAKAEG